MRYLVNGEPSRVVTSAAGAEAGRCRLGQEDDGGCAAVRERRERKLYTPVCDGLKGEEQ